jgi:hypothetical protein
VDVRTRPAPPRAVTVLRALAGGARVGLGAGVLGGLAARVLMRGFALALGHEPSPASLLGTTGIVLAFVLAAVPGSLAVALGARRAGGWLLLAGGLMVGSQSVVIGLEEGATRLLDGPAPALGVALALAFAAVVVGQQVLAGRLAARVAARVRTPGAGRGPGTLAGRVPR